MVRRLYLFLGTGRGGQVLLTSLFTGYQTIFYQASQSGKRTRNNEEVRRTLGDVSEDGPASVLEAAEMCGCCWRAVGKHSRPSFRAGLQG